MNFKDFKPPTTKAKLLVYPNGHWAFPTAMGTNKEIGFIYLIRDRELDMFYLGQKLFRGHGKFNKGVESNWKKYKSSSPALAQMFKERPINEFDFIAIEQYKTKGMLTYAENWSLYHVEAPTKTFWYNKLIGKLSWSVKEQISERHKKRLEMALAYHDFKEEYNLA